MEQTLNSPPFVDLSLPLAGDESELQADGREEALMRLGHKGTHLDRVLRTKVPLEYFKSRALAFDVRALARDRAVETGDLPLELVRAQDFVLIRTGAMERHGYGSRAYLDEFFELSWAVIEQLAERKVRFIGVDARGIRRNAEHAEADARCERSGIYVIENMTGTEKLPLASPFTIYVMWFDLGGTGIPCRCLASLDEK
jgi:kynurenine formamidase